MSAQRRPANERATGPQPARTPAQQRALHAQRRALGMDDATWRALLAQYPRETGDGAGPCTSSAQLSRRQARAVISRLEIAGAPVGRPYAGRKPGPASTAQPTAIATPAQRALIQRLIDEVQWRQEDGYARWLAGRHSPTRGQHVRTYHQAEAVIDALRRMRDAQAPAEA